MRAISITALLSIALSACVPEHGPRGEQPEGSTDTPPGEDPKVPPGELAPIDPACDEELAFFTTEIDTPILTARCIGCHNPAGVAKATDLQLTSDDTLANYRAAAKVAQKIAYGRSVLLLKPSLTHPDGHTGGELVSVGSPEYLALEQFVGVVADASCNPPPNEPIACDAPRAGPRLLRRLSRGEFDATVRDLLGVTGDFGARLASDEIVDGFDNDAEALVVSPLLADQLREAAEAIGIQTDIAPLLSCDPANGNEACARTFIETFGQRAFRRPLESTEVTRLLALHRDIVAGGTFSDGIRWMLTAMLQSPSFLYRRELGTAAAGSSDYLLDPWEIASALSYGITGTMPDELLFQAASAGELTTPQQVAAQAERLFRSPAALGGVNRFVSQWVEIDTLDTVPKDSATFPEFDFTIRDKLRRETELFVSAVLYQGSGTLTELLTADYTYLDESLAAYYGVTIPAGAPEIDGWKQVSFAPDHQAGLLTQGSFLATHARPNDGSPIHRGRVVRERLLCQELPPPPPGVNAEPPAPDPNQTTRERYAAHSQNDACSSCHRLIDPIGFGFERFDGIGRFRSALQADDSGEIIEGATGAPFTGTQGLGELLASRTDVSDCFAEQWLRYSFGTSLGGDLSCSLNTVRDTFSANGGSIQSLAVAVTQTAHFMKRTGEPTTPVDPMDPPMDPPVDPMDPPAQDTLRVEVRVDSDWGAGYCHQVTATNDGTAELDWSLALDVEGTITTHWNADASATSGRVTFQGVDFNNVIGPTESASFGFCANR